MTAQTPIHTWALSRLSLAILFVCLIAGCTTNQVPIVPTLAPTRVPAQATPLSPMPPSLAALAAQSQSIGFDHLPPERGLSQSVVLDLVQDAQGFLWLATQDGLNRFDGYEFKIFKNDPSAPNSLPGNLLSSLERDLEGNLWIGMVDGGLSRYDPNTGIFTSYRNDPQSDNSLSEDSVSALDIDMQGMVWAGTNNHGLNRLDPRTGLFTHYQNNQNDPQSLSADTVYTVLCEASGAVWVGTLGGGLDRLDPRTGRFTHYQYNDNDTHTISENSIQSLYIDRQGTLWVGTFTAGLNRFDAQTGEFKHYAVDSTDATSLSHNSVSAILEDRAGNLWVGTQGGGLNLLDRDSGKFTHYRNRPIDPDSLGNNSVISLFEDSAGILWIGTFGAGADYYDPFKHKFLHVRADPENPQGLSSNSLWSLLEDDDGVLWITTINGGINRFDTRNGEWRHYRNDANDPTSVSTDNVYVAYQDGEGAMWFGTPNGLSQFDREQEQFRNHALPAIFAIYEDRQGRFWLGSALGLMLFDRTAGNALRTFRSDPNDPTSLSSDSVTSLLEDAEGRFWVGTGNGGLNLFDRETHRTTRFMHNPENLNSLSNNTVTLVCQARDGTLWLGTSGGLNHFDPKTQAFTIYRERDGLPNDVVYGVLEDDAGNFWASTNKGLTRFNPRTQTFKNFDMSDGLQGLEFNQWSLYRNKEGVMYFGGVNGLNAFHPSRIQDNAFVPPVVLTDFKIYHKSVPIGPASPLHQPIENTNRLQLAYDDDFFEFEFAALHFSAPNEIQYMYKMDGLDKDWIDAGGDRTANYTNVPPGDYVLRVKGTNSDGVWNEQGVALSINIPPPFWETAWFRGLSALAVFGIIGGAFALRIRSVEQQRRKLEIQVEQRTQQLHETMTQLEHAKDAAEAASHAKSTFLANMSHEFRTPLNAILGFTQVMTRDKRLSSDHRQEIEIIHRSGEHLLGLINEVLEMSKIEAGRSALNERAFDLRQLLVGLEEMFAVRAEQKGIALKLETAQDVPRYVKSDEGKLRQVLMNLMGNAVKFTQQGSVDLRVKVQHAERNNEPTHDGNAVEAEAEHDRMRDNDRARIHFVVADTGPGIAADELDKLFTPFVQADAGRQLQEGTGLGLAISQQYVRLMGGEICAASEPGKGSTFEFEIPVDVVSVNELEKPPVTHRVVGLQPNQPTYRLLIVDDQEVNRKLLVKILEPIGFQVREAANGQAALAIWETWAPHLIWMDMRMPLMDGYEATRRIKNTTRGMATIIIALTASALEQDRALILSEGCDDYVRKPFQEQDLFDLLAKHLGVRYRFEAIEKKETLQSVSFAREEEWVSRRQAVDAEWRAELERAATLGDQDEIERLANEIRAQDPELAAGVLELAESFDHDRILELIRRCGNTVRQV